MEYATKGMTQIYSSMAVALSAEYGPLKNGLGPAWIDGLPYWCDGSQFIVIPSDGVAENAGVDYAVKGMTQIYSSMALAISYEYGAEKNGRGPVWIAGLPYWCDGVGFISISVAGVPAIIPGLEYAVRGMTQIYSSMAVAISPEYGANRHGRGPAWIGGALYWCDGTQFTLITGGEPPLNLNNDPSWISNFTVFTRDAQGWTIFAPNLESQIVYVDATNGNDATGQIYDLNDTTVFADPINNYAGVNAFQTVQAAALTRRAGKPDWILFKKGETWDVDKYQFNLIVGKSVTERQFIGSYGGSTIRPVIESDDRALLLWNGIQFNSVFGIDFYGSRRDPNNAKFKGWASTDSAAAGVLGYDSGNVGVTPNGYLLMEDCVVSFFYQGHTMSGNGINPDMQYRRCQFLDMHDWNRLVSVGFGGAHMHSFLDECLLDKNGWYEKVQSRYTETVITALTGVAETSVVVSSPIPVNAPAVGAIGLVLDSVGGGGDNSTDLRVEYTSFSGSTFTIPATDFSADNVSAGTNMVIVTSDADSRNHNHYCAEARESIRKNNISLRPSSIHMKYSANPPVAPNSIFAWDVAMYGNLFAEGEVVASFGGNTDWNDGERLRNFRYEDNVSMFIGRSQPSHRSLGWGVQPIDNLDSVISRNYFLHTDNNAIASDYIVDVQGHTTNMVVDDNVAYSLSGLTNAIDLTDNANFTNVTESNNAIELPANYYVDPTRTIETYMTSLGMTPTIEEFAIKCRAQSKDNWDVRFTAEAVNAYVKAGYQLAIAVPIITAQPTSNTGILAPAPFILTVGAYSNKAITYQWFKDGAAISGATSSTYNSGATVVNQNGDYHCVVTSDGNTVSTNVASMLAVGALPLSLNGTNAKITLPAYDYVAGDKIAVQYSATGNTTYSSLINRNNVRFYTSDRVRWSNGAVEIDGVAKSSGSGYPEIADGDIHVLTHILASDTSAGYIMIIGSAGTSEWWAGKVGRVQILAANDTVKAQWDFDTPLVNVPPTVGTGDAVISNGAWA